MIVVDDQLFSGAERIKEKNSSSTTELAKDEANATWHEEPLKIDEVESNQPKQPQPVTKPEPPTLPTIPKPDDVEAKALFQVKSGLILDNIAKKYKIEAADINTSNQLDASAPLKIGMQLLLPGATEIAIATAPIKRVPVGIKSIIAPAPTTKSTGSNWVWPTNWHVITQYYGWRHTGIDIDGDYSTFSIAAHEGVVSFTGWRNGYGLTVEMDHGNGLKTRYAHNSKIYVSKGDVVAAGGRLAQTGTTGNSTGTHLHFEVLLNGQFQNPLSYVR